MLKLTMRRLAAAAALAAVLAFARVFAQTPVQPGTGTIAGRVLDGATGQPVAGALVYIDAQVRSSSRDGTVRSGRTVTSGARGEFAFSDVAAGSHNFEATKNGYRAGYAGATSAMQAARSGATVLSAGETKTGITIRMWQNAAITGHVRSASGRPIVGATVTALRPQGACGSERLSLASMSTLTDDQGEFRLFDLAPGSYAVSVKSNLSGTVEAANRRAQGLGGYPTIYLPNSVDPAMARRISLAAGDEHRDADLTMPDSGFTIRGRVTLADGQEPAASYLVELFAA